MNKDKFMKKYSISPESLDLMSWETLGEIYQHYKHQMKFLEQQAEVVANILRLNKMIHTVRSRVKDPEHLIEKLIRKLPERRVKYGDEFTFTVENYMSEITDLIGVRAIHIFKEDWREIHDYITTQWEVSEVNANLRNGDDSKLYEETGLQIDIRTSGYRSVHYLINVAPTKVPITIEIQVRTIFEEGYGEIDHLISYPHNNVPRVIAENLLTLNRIAGSADEIASFVNSLKTHLAEMESKLVSKEFEIAALKIKIEKMEMSQNDKNIIIDGLKNINSSNYKIDFNPGFYYEGGVLKSINNDTLINLSDTFPQSQIGQEQRGDINTKIKDFVEKVNAEDGRE
jgi:ppGpp synthetase/RelA/SpoT-type nucleotidyltranferase